MGAFGMLAMALLVLALRQVSSDENWPGTEKYVRISFWGLNIGLALMVVGSLFPGGVMQLWEVLNNGYWHARSLEYMNQTRVRLIKWLHMPGDTVFIIFGVIPMLIATGKTYVGIQARA